MENIVMIPVSWIEPHPDNPRKDLGDLTELTESIRHNGIYQNLTVVPKTEPIKTSADETMAEISINEEKDPRLKEFKQKEKDHGRRLPGGYVVIIGHRRLAAAKKAGLTRVPCAIAYMSMQKQIETMILENMQRADLTIYEQVKGFQQLLDLGDSVEGIAKKTGFTEKTIRRRTEIGRLDPDKLERIMKGRGKQLTLEDFDKLAKIDDVETRNRLLEEIGTRNFEYVVAAAKAAQETKKMLPAVMDWIQSLKHKTEKVSESTAYQYETLMPYPGIEIKKWKTEKGAAEVALEKLPPTKKLFFCITEGGYLRLYQKGLTAVQAPKKTEEEIKREKEINAAWDYLIEQSKLTYGLRKTFIDDFKVTKANYEKVVEGALYAVVANVLGYYPWDRGNLRGLLAVDGEECKGMDTQEIAATAVEKLDLSKSKTVEKLPELIWGLFNDGPEMICSENSWRGEWPKYGRNKPALRALYKWLEGLGYQISEVERGLIQGTDINYHLGDAEVKK